MPGTSPSFRHLSEYDDYVDPTPRMQDDDGIEEMFDSPDDLDESIEDLAYRTFEPGDQLYYQGELFEVLQVWSMDEAGETDELDLLHDEATLPKFAETKSGSFSLSVPDSDLVVERLPAILIAPLEEGTGTAEQVIVYETAEIQR
jgi:hypothetical protein